MFKRFKGLMALFAIICVTAIAGGSAYFYFGGKVSDDAVIDNSPDTPNDNEVKADNILENYEFGVDRDLNETYTYYFFPSTLYMSDKFYSETVKPENVFGYNEVLLDDNGDPVLDSNNQPQYKIVKDNISGISENGTSYDSYYWYLKNYFNDQSSSYLAGGEYARRNYPITTKQLHSEDYWDWLTHIFTYYYGHEYFRDPYVVNNPYIVDYLTHEKDFASDKYYPSQNVSGSYAGTRNFRFYSYSNDNNTHINIDYSWGSIETDLNSVLSQLTLNSEATKENEVLSPRINDETNRFGIDLELTSENESVIQTFINSEGNSIALSDNYSGRMVGKSQYRNDRFGFWTAFYDWDDPNNSSSYIENSASRYLPIKITVNGNLTPDDMAKVIPTLSASMFDNNMWFDFTANVWTYAPYDSESEKYDKVYNSAVDGFTAKDITYIFDIMQNPSKYADENNVIRLFPVFSNGKNSDASSVSDGGGDAIQASFSYAPKSSPSIQNDMRPSSTKLTYSSYTYSGTANGFYNYSVNYAALKNVEIKDGKYDSITFKIDTTYFDEDGPHWGGHWIDVYTLDANYIKNFVTTYGEGLYTFYLFLGNRGVNSSISNTTAFPNVNGKTLLENVVSYSDSSNELFNKYLISVGTPTWAQTEKGQGDQGDNSSVNTPNYSRPVALAVEKVTNLRLVSDIPIAVDDNGEASVNQDWDSIDGNIHQGLLNAKNFTIADEVYGFDSDIYKEDNIDLSSGKRLDTNNPYIYVIQNADFRFVNNLYFQIRFSNDYINNAMNVTTDYSSITGDKPNKYVAYSVNGQILKFKFQGIDPKEDDVFIQNASAGSEGNERQGFKLKDYNARGIYDILLISHGTSSNSQQYSQQYYMYVNRHTNSFIKLFYGNPGIFEFTPTGSTEQQTGNSFVRHKLPTEDTTEGDTQARVDTSTLLWNGQTYLGEYLTTSSTGTRYSRDGDNEEQVIEKPSDASLYAAIRDKCGITPGTDNIYKIIDAVTGRVVAYYNSGVGRIFTSEGSTGSGDSKDAINLFTIMKNYVLYIEPIDPEPIQ